MKAVISNLETVDDNFQKFSAVINGQDGYWLAQNHLTACSLLIKPPKTDMSFMSTVNPLEGAQSAAEAVSKMITSLADCSPQPTVLPTSPSRVREVF